MKWTNKFRPYLLFWAVTLGVLLLDQATKLWIQWAYHNFADVFYHSFGNILSLVYVRNTGAAWGALSGTGPYLGLLALGALAAIYFLRKALQINRPVMQVAFGLLVAGIAGNMLDRLILGYVVDFIDLSFISFPSFNVADAGITIGVIMYVLLGSYENEAKADGEVEESPKLADSAKKE